MNMHRHLSRKVIRQELTLLHVIILVTSNLFIGAGIALLLAHTLLPYSFPLIVLGALFLLPTLYLLTKAEKKEEDII